MGERRAVPRPRSSNGLWTESGRSLACLAALALGFVASGITPVLLLGAVFQFFVLFLNTTIWIYAPELYPTRIRGFAVAFILATGTAAGALTPILSGRLFEAYGFGGVFGLIALMYAVFALSIRFSPETFGHSLEEVDIPVPPGDCGGPGLMSGSQRPGSKTILLINPNTSAATTAMMVEIARATAGDSVFVRGATASVGPRLIIDEQGARCVHPGGPAHCAAGRGRGVGHDRVRVRRPGP